MKYITKTVGIGILVIAGVAVVVGWRQSSHVQPNNGTPVTISGVKSEDVAAISAYSYTKTYISSKYGFTFMYPESFTITDMPGKDRDVVIVSNIEKGIGVQIIITPIDGEDHDLTADRIKEEIPDMAVEMPTQISVTGSRQGLEFASDNSAFGGRSSELWFIYNRHLFQISTYAEFEPLLRGMWNTWKFN